MKLFGFVLILTLLNISCAISDEYKTRDQYFEDFFSLEFFNAEQTKKLIISAFHHIKDDKLKTKERIMLNVAIGLKSVNKILLLIEPIDPAMSTCGWTKPIMLIGKYTFDSSKNISKLSAQLSLERLKPCSYDVSVWAKTKNNKIFFDHVRLDRSGKMHNYMGF